MWFIFGPCADLFCLFVILMYNICNVPIIQPNATPRSNAIVFYYTLQHVSTVQISHLQVDAGHIEMPLCPCIPFVYSTLHDDGWSGQPKYVAVCNKRKIYQICTVVIGRKMNTFLRNVQLEDVQEYNTRVVSVYVHWIYNCLLLNNT